MIKTEPIQQNISTFYVSIPNSKSFKVYENMAELKRDIEKSTIIVEDFKIPFSIID